jgi:hypothetical protein
LPALVAGTGDDIQDMISWPQLRGLEHLMGRGAIELLPQRG